MAERVPVEFSYEKWQRGVFECRRRRTENSFYITIYKGKGIEQRYVNMSVPSGTPVPRVGDMVEHAPTQPSDIEDLSGTVASVTWRVDPANWLSFAPHIGAEIVLVDEPLQQPAAPKPTWSEQRMESIKHRIEVSGRLGWVYEYANGRCWARVEAPDKKLGSFPDLETARVAVQKELSGG